MLRFLLALLPLCAASAWAADGRLIVLNKADGTANVIDVSTGETLKQLEVGPEPHEGVVSRDGRWLYVSNYSAGSVSAVDLVGEEPRRRMKLGQGSMPHGLAWLGDELLVTAEARMALLRIDPATGTEKAALATTQKVAHMVAVAPDHKHAYTANIGSGSCSRFDLEGDGNELDVVATGAQAEGIAVCPATGEVWVTNRAGDSLSVIDPKSFEKVADIPCAGFPIRGAFTPDGARFLATCAKSGEVALIDARTRTEAARIQLNQAGSEGEAPIFGDEFGSSPVPIGVLVHPSGSEAYVACAAAAKVAVIDLHTGRVRAVFATGDGPDGLAFVPVQAKDA